MNIKNLIKIHMLRIKSEIGQTSNTRVICDVSTFDRVDLRENMLILIKPLRLYILTLTMFF